MKPQLKCLICKKESPNSAELETHFKNHELSEIQRFPCHLCSLKFVKFSTLEKHLQIVHLEKKQWNKSDKCDELNSLRQEVKNLCSTIGKKPETKSINVEESSAQKAEEKIKSTTERLDDDDDSFEGNDTIDETLADDSESQVEEKKEKFYRCTFDGCSSVLRHQSSFIMHERCVHREEKPFTCEICSKSFKTISNLNVHIKMHKNQRDHLCIICNQAFFTSSHLKAHIKIHSKEVGYRCEVAGCSKTFIHQSSFKKHQIFHSGVRNHQCGICQRDFSQACHLREHLKIHSNERNHICGLCRKAFRRPDTLRIHLNTHASRSP